MTMQRQTITTYPDILGMFSKGQRLNSEAIQAAAGVYPRSAAVGQPFEVLVLLQSCYDQLIPMTVTIQLPRRDPNGNRLSLFTPQDTIPITVQPGEVGLLHIPIVPKIPTPPTTNCPINLIIDSKKPRAGKVIRSEFGGRMAGYLPMSPYRLSILREVSFAANLAAPNIIVSRFDILPGQILGPTADMSARYETIWSAKDLAQDQEQYAVLEARTQQESHSLTRTKAYQPLIDETNRRFSNANFPLLPGEAVEIAKLLTYAMEDGLELEEGFKLTESRWFQLLASYIDNDALLEDSPRLIAELYPGVLYDAIRLGFHMVGRSVRDNLGTPTEQAQQADRIVAALEGERPVELSYIYLPMILAGLMLHARVKGSSENLWTSLEQTRQNWQIRTKSGVPFPPLVARLMESSLANTEQFLIRSRVPRP